jgi:type II secretory pathway pseudopilin PulG
MICRGQASQCGSWRKPLGCGKAAGGKGVRKASRVDGARRAGITLVELLVVIAIIATLVGILMPAIYRAMERADINRAKQEMASISAAIMAFFREYGIMPTPDTNGYPDHTFTGKRPSGTDPLAGNPRAQKLIMDILRGINTTNNPRRIVFLDVPESSMTGRDMYGTTSTPANGYYLDPWGNPYLIVMDTDFDDLIGGFADIIGGISGLSALGPYIIDMSPRKNGSFPGVKVGVMSLGPEPGKTNSFLKSW